MGARAIAWVSIGPKNAVVSVLVQVLKPMRRLVLQLRVGANARSGSWSPA